MNERSWNGVALGAIAVMVGVLITQLLLPTPKLGKVVQTRRNEETKLRKEIEKLRDEVSTVRVKNEKRLWAQPADQVGAAAMAKVTEIAASKALKVLAFRPQRTVDDTGVTRHPYQVSIDGSFVQVLEFVRALETPNLRLPVVTVQLAAADGATDRVTATIGIVAYRAQQETKK